MVLSDLHIPFHCQRAVTLALAVGCSLKPDIIILDGDIVDNWEISEFYKNPKHHNKDNLKSEILQARAFLAELRRLFPESRIVYIFGNHEFRWMKYIAKHARELAELDGMTLEEQLRCAENRIEVINNDTKENCFAYGKLIIGHFDLANKYSGYTAKNLADQKSISLIQGHTHRGGSSFRRLYDRDIAAYENFCLCNRNPEFVDHPNWQLGFSIIYKDKTSDFFQVNQHYIAELGDGADRTYKTIFNGLIYEN